MTQYIHIESCCLPNPGIILGFQGAPAAKAESPNYSYTWVKVSVQVRTSSRQDPNSSCKARFCADATVINEAPGL